MMAMTGGGTTPKCLDQALALARQRFISGGTTA